MKPRIYTVATAHLDTSWNWDFEKTLSEYIPATLNDNFEWFEKFPDYTFSFEGSYRYELMEEYYPELFEKLKEYVAAGRWHVAGSAFENGDVNIPSPEALFRDFLYGNDYFDKTFGKRSVDVYLPDCFGFGYALPSIAAHANLRGFTTQKMLWSCAYGCPFPIGRWKGPDGNEIFVCLDGRDYNASLKTVRKHGGVNRTLKANERKYDLPVSFVLHGRGDRGGAPRLPTVETVCKETALNSSSKVDVLVTYSDHIFRDLDALDDTAKKKLPIWKNELVMTDHGAGCYTSRAASKRFNRRCEMLAEAAERACVAAEILGVQQYPQKQLETAWKRFIAHQFHDDITGTSQEVCYQRNWNDYIMSLNQFAEEYRSATAALTRALNTGFAKGTAIAVSNPLQSERTETVTAKINTLADVEDVAVFNSKNEPVASQLVSRDKDGITVAFSASVPSVGIGVFDVRFAEKADKGDSTLSVTERTLMNEKYKVTLDDNGDIASIYDKFICKELLKAPIRMALNKFDGSISWPSWELEYKEVIKDPVAYAGNPKFEIVADGAARVAIKTTRTALGSDFIQIISLDKGGEFVRVYNEVEWRTLRALLHTDFQLTVSNPLAVYDLGLGVIARGNRHKKMYEVPAQMWADISAEEYGVSVFSDSRVGWEKPNDNTLWLTGVYSPRAPYRANQHMQEQGLNRYSFAIYSHSGTWQEGTQQAANRFNMPMSPFEVEKHAGHGESFSFAEVDNNNVIIRAVKKAENSNEIVVRLNELTGVEQNYVTLSLGGGIEEAREIWASEEPRPDTLYKLRNGKLVFDMKPFEVRSFALKLKRATLPCAVSTPVSLLYNQNGVTSNSNRTAGALPNGLSIPAELFPKMIECGGVHFKFADIVRGEQNCVLCGKQKIKLPDNSGKVHIIAASFDGDKQAVFGIGDKEVKTRIQSAEERIGAWDMYSLGETGYIKTDTLAWSATHQHSEKGDEYGRQLYFFKYSFDVPTGADMLTLPDDDKIVVLAVTATEGEMSAEFTDAPFDRLEKREFTYKLTPELAMIKTGKLLHKKYEMKFAWGFARRRIEMEIRQRRKNIYVD